MDASCGTSLSLPPSAQFSKGFQGGNACMGQAPCCVLLADALQGRPAGEGKCGGTGSVLEITDIITLHTGPLGG